MQFQKPAIAVAQCLLWLTAVVCGAGRCLLYQITANLTSSAFEIAHRGGRIGNLNYNEVSPHPYSQHDYDRHDSTPMTFDVASYACIHTGGILEIPFVSIVETHYRNPAVFSEMSTYWYWAHVRRDDDGAWRWLNGTLVDLTPSAMVNLAAQPSPEGKDCAVWQLYKSFSPVSCEESHHFLCLRKRDSFCRLRGYNRTNSVYDIDFASWNYSTFDSLPDAVSSSSVLSSPVMYQATEIGKKGPCRDACDQIHANESLPVGCWFVRYDRQLAKNERCLMLLARHFPDTLYAINLRDYEAVSLFRTCFLQKTYVNETCPLQCSCRKPAAPSTLAEAQAEDKKIKAELTVPTSNLSATVRRKTSASDPRPSAEGIGLVGVGLVIGVLGAVVVLDMGSLWRDIRLMMRHLKEGCGLGTDEDMK